MGLTYKPGVGLITKGGALGTGTGCCCGATPPATCYCPNLCRYYFHFGGTAQFAARNILQGKWCPPGREDIVETATTPYGLATDPGTIRQSHATRAYNDSRMQTSTGTGQVSSPTGPCYDLILSHQIDVSGNTPQTAFTDLFGYTWEYSRQVFYQSYLNLSVTPGEKFGFSGQPPNTWGAQVELIQTVYLTKYYSAPETYYLHRKHFRAWIPIPAECVVNADYECKSSDALARLHMKAASAAFTIQGTTGVMYGGTMYPWEKNYVTGPQADFDSGHTEWHVPGEFPLTNTIEVSVEADASCNPLP